MNALCLRDFFRAVGIQAVVQCSIGMEPIAPRFNRDEAIRALEAGKIVIFAGGTGSPFFTTDTTSALRALETDCDAVLKATKVDGVYTADPFKDPAATRYAELSFDEALARYTDEHELTEVQTTNMGSLFMLEYAIRLKEPGLEKRLIDDLRCLNGNLKITCGRAAAAKDVL